MTDKEKSMLNSSEVEISRLAKYLARHFPDEPGRGHGGGIGEPPCTSESTVDVAIRLLGELRRMVDEAPR